MNEPMRNYMKVGIIHFMIFPETIKGEGPILETLKKIAVDEYFDTVEITWIKDSVIRNQARKMLETAHMTIAYGAQPRLLTTGQNLNSINEKKRKEAVANVMEGIDEAYEIGAVGCTFLSGRYELDTQEKAYNSLVKSTRELCDYAKSKGKLKIIHEIFDSNVDKKSLIGPVDLAKKYAEEICESYDNFGLMVDLSHLPLLRETPEQAILPIKDFLAHAHIGNCVVQSPSMPAYGDMHPRFGFPGGENDIEELVRFLKVLLDIGFLNDRNPPIVSFEVKPFADEDSDLVIINAKRVLNAAWAKL
ncbi:MAG: TIM barrel protein [Planctomycetota bacterium]